MSVNNNKKYSQIMRVDTTTTTSKAVSGSLVYGVAKSGGFVPLSQAIFLLNRAILEQNVYMS